MEPAGRRVGALLRRIRDKDESKPGRGSATETKKSPERADKIHRGGDGVAVRVRQPSRGVGVGVRGSSDPLRPVRRRNDTTNNTGKRRRLTTFSPPSTCTRPTPVRGKRQNKSLSAFVYSAAAARAAESSNMRAPNARANPQLTADVIACRKRNSFITKPFYTEKPSYVRVRHYWFHEMYG